MFGRGSIQLVRVFGIRVGVDASWFLVLFFFIFLLSGSFRATLNSSDTVAYLTAVAAVLLFFGSLILHELGHALVARRLGIGIAGIDLWFFGGLAKMQRDADSPGTEFKIAVAGPLVTLAVVVVCLAASVALTDMESLRQAALLQAGAQSSPGEVLLGWLADINLLVFAFNLIPGLPLDGGRIARAIAWKVTGDRLRATRLAATLGQGFSYVMIGLGLFLLVQGGATAGLWLMVLGWFLSQAARSTVAQTAFTERLGGVTVADIMDPEPVSIPASLPVSRARDEFFLRYRWPWFPVVDAAGRFVGLLREEGVGGTHGSSQDARPVDEVVDRDAADAKVVEDTPLESLLGSEALQRVGALMAVDREGVLRGVVTLDAVRRALHTAATTRS